MTRRRVIRFSLLAALCLLLGAATTVGVAWGLSMQDLGIALNGAPLSRSARPRVSGEGEGFLFTRRRAFGGGEAWFAEVTPAAGHVGYQAGLAAPESLVPMDIRPLVLPWVSGLEDWPLEGEYAEVKVVAFGWPLPSCACKLAMGQPARREWSSLWRFRSPERANVVPGFPTHVRLVPFAGNALLFALVWTAILSTAQLLRIVHRRFRVSRGMCSSCGYDLKGSTGGVCPECGTGCGPCAMWTTDPPSQLPQGTDL
jgi:hypothetical protein